MKKDKYEKMYQITYCNAQLLLSISSEFPYYFPEASNHQQEEEFEGKRISKSLLICTINLAINTCCQNCYPRD